MCRLFRAGSHQCTQNSRRRLIGVVDFCRMAAGTSWKLAEDAYEFIFVKGRPTNIRPKRRRRPFSLHRPATPPKPHVRLRREGKLNHKFQMLFLNLPLRSGGLFSVSRQFSFGACVRMDAPNQQPAVVVRRFHWGALPTENSRTNYVLRKQYFLDNMNLKMYRIYKE